MTRTITLIAGLLVFCSPSSAQTWTPYEVKSGMSYFYGMTVADFGAGHLQVAFADSLASSRKMLRTDNAIVFVGDGLSGLKPVYTETMNFHPNPAPNPHKLVERMATVDVDGDGDKDIVAVANSHDAVLAYLNPGTSGLSWTRTLLTMSTPGAVNVAVGDLNGDGLPDIAVSMRQQAAAYPVAKPGVGWLKNLGSGAWVYADIQVNTGMTEPRGLVITDIFPGGGKELLVTGNGMTRAYRWNGAWNVFNVNGVDTSGVVYTASADVFGNSLEEYIYASADGLYAAEISWNVLNPPVTKLTSLSSPNGVKVAEIVPVDMDGDGVTELVFALRNDGVYYVKKSGASWQLKTVSTVPENYHAVAVMDYDLDGRKDILTGIEYPGNTLQVWHNLP